MMLSSILYKSVSAVSYFFLHLVMIVFLQTFSLSISLAVGNDQNPHQQLKAPALIKQLTRTFSSKTEAYYSFKDQINNVASYYKKELTKNSNQNEDSIKAKIKYLEKRTESVLAQLKNIERDTVLNKKDMETQFQEIYDNYHKELMGLDTKLYGKDGRLLAPVSIMLQHNLGSKSNKSQRIENQPTSSNTLFINSVIPEENAPTIKLEDILYKPTSNTEQNNKGLLLASEELGEIRTHGNDYQDLVYTEAPARSKVITTRQVLSTLDKKSRQHLKSSAPLSKDNLFNHPDLVTSNEKSNLGTKDMQKNNSKSGNKYASADNDSDSYIKVKSHFLSTDTLHRDYNDTDRLNSRKGFPVAVKEVAKSGPTQQTKQKQFRDGELLKNSTSNHQNAKKSKKLDKILNTDHINQTVETIEDGAMDEVNHNYKNYHRSSSKKNKLQALSHHALELADDTDKITKQITESKRVTKPDHCSDELKPGKHIGGDIPSRNQELSVVSTSNEENRTQFKTARNKSGTKGIKSSGTIPADRGYGSTKQLYYGIADDKTNNTKQPYVNMNSILDNSTVQIYNGGGYIEIPTNFTSVHKEFSTEDRNNRITSENFPFYQFIENKFTEIAQDIETEKSHKDDPEMEYYLNNFKRTKATIIKYQEMFANKHLLPNTYEENLKKEFIKLLSIIEDNGQRLDLRNTLLESVNEQKVGQEVRDQYINSIGELFNLAEQQTKLQSPRVPNLLANNSYSESEKNYGGNVSDKIAHDETEFLSRQDLSNSSHLINDTSFLIAKDKSSLHRSKWLAMPDRKAATKSESTLKCDDGVSTMLPAAADVLFNSSVAGTTKDHRKDMLAQIMQGNIKLKTPTGQGEQEGLLPPPIPNGLFTNNPPPPPPIPNGLFTNNPPPPPPIPNGLFTDNPPPPPPIPNGLFTDNPPPPPIPQDKSVGASKPLSSTAQKLRDRFAKQTQIPVSSMSDIAAELKKKVKPKDVLAEEIVDSKQLKSSPFSDNLIKTSKEYKSIINNKAKYTLQFFDLSTQQVKEIDITPSVKTFCSDFKQCQLRELLRNKDVEPTLENIQNKEKEYFHSLIKQKLYEYVIQGCKMDFVQYYDDKIKSDIYKQYYMDVEVHNIRKIEGILNERNNISSMLDKEIQLSVDSKLHETDPKLYWQKITEISDKYDKQLAQLPQPVIKVAGKNIEYKMYLADITLNAKKRAAQADILEQEANSLPGDARVIIEAISGELTNKEIITKENFLSIIKNFGDRDLNPIKPIITIDPKDKKIAELLEKYKDYTPRKKTENCNNKTISGNIKTEPELMDQPQQNFKHGEFFSFYNDDQFNNNDTTADGFNSSSIIDALDLSSSSKPTFKRLSKKELFKTSFCNEQNLGKSSNNKKELRIISNNNVKLQANINTISNEEPERCNDKTNLTTSTPLLITDLKQTILDTDHLIADKTNSLNYTNNELEIVKNLKENVAAHITNELSKQKVITSKTKIVHQILDDKNDITLSQVDLLREEIYKKIKPTESDHVLKNQIRQEVVNLLYNQAITEESSKSSNTKPKGFNSKVFANDLETNHQNIIYGSNTSLLIKALNLAIPNEKSLLSVPAIDTDLNASLPLPSRMITRSTSLKKRLKNHSQKISSIIQDHNNQTSSKLPILDAQNDTPDDSCASQLANIGTIISIGENIKYADKLLIIDLKSKYQENIDVSVIETNSNSPLPNSSINEPKLPLYHPISSSKSSYVLSSTKLTKQAHLSTNMADHNFTKRSTVSAINLNMESNKPEQIVAAQYLSNTPDLLANSLTSITNIITPKESYNNQPNNYLVQQIPSPVDNRNDNPSRIMQSESNKGFNECETSALVINSESPYYKKIASVFYSIPRDNKSLIQITVGDTDFAVAFKDKAFYIIQASNNINSTELLQHAFAKYERLIEHYSDIKQIEWGTEAPGMANTTSENPSISFLNQGDRVSINPTNKTNNLRQETNSGDLAAISSEVSKPAIGTIQRSVNTINNIPDNFSTIGANAANRNVGQQSSRTQNSNKNNRTQVTAVIERATAKADINDQQIDKNQTRVSLCENFSAGASNDHTDLELKGDKVLPTETVTKVGEPAITTHTVPHVVLATTIPASSGGYAIPGAPLVEAEVINPVKTAVDDITKINPEQNLDARIEHQTNNHDPQQLLEVDVLEYEFVAATNPVPPAVLTHRATKFGSNQQLSLSATGNSWRNNKVAFIDPETESRITITGENPLYLKIKKILLAKGGNHWTVSLPEDIGGGSVTVKLNDDGSIVISGDGDTIDDLTTLLTRLRTGCKSNQQPQEDNNQNTASTIIDSLKKVKHKTNAEILTIVQKFDGTQYDKERLLAKTKEVIWAAIKETGGTVKGLKHAAMLFGAESGTEASKLAMDAVNFPTLTQAAAALKKNIALDTSLQEIVGHNISQVNNSLNHRINSTADRSNLLGKAAGDDETSIDQKTYGVWIMPLYAKGVKKGQKGVYDGYKEKLYGKIIGADTGFNDNMTMIGFAISFVNSNVKYNNSYQDRTKTDSTIFSLYGKQDLRESWFMQWITSYSSTKVNHKEERIFSFGSQMAQGNYTSRSYSGEILLGYDARLDTVVLSPFAGISYAKSRDGGYKESGLPFANRTVVANHRDKIDAIAGARLSGTVNTDNYVIIPEIYGMLSKRIKGNTGKLLAKIDGINEPFTGIPQISSSTSIIGIGITAKSGIVEYGAGYDLQLANKYAGHQATLKVRVNF